MNIFVDNHHPALAHSLELLLGKRLGHRVVYPIGREWHEKGFFRVFSKNTAVGNFLEMNRADEAVRSEKSIKTASREELVDPQIRYCPDICNDVYQRTVSFEEFLKMPFEIVIASVPSHVKPFSRLVDQYKPFAKLVFQMGNMFEEFDFLGVENILNSTDRIIPAGIHNVSYSQEFDEKIFSYTPPAHSKKIMSFINYLADFKEGSVSTNLLGEYLPDYRFETYGSGNVSGVLTKTALVAEKMKECDFVWHVKKDGDGYGHVLHNAAALGRPVILSKKTYEKLRFGKFIEDGKTCVVVDGLDTKTLSEKIRHCGDPERLEKMSRAIRERFEEFVDFLSDGEKVKKFFETLK